jgi:hypothetical protein
MKKYFSYIFALSLIIGCKEIVDPGPQNMSINKSTIMPLKVGNSWTYQITDIDTVTKQTSTSTITITIQSAKVIRGETWFVDNSGGVYINRSNGLWYANDENDTTFLAKYPAAIQDTFNVHSFYPSLFTVISVDSNVQTEAGTFNCFVYKNSDSNGNSVKCYSPGVGLISLDAFLVSANSDSFFLKWKILSYKVN